MHKRLHHFARLVLIAGCLLLHPVLQAQDARLIDRIIAIVGEDAVMLSELRIESQKLAKRMQQQGQATVDQGAIQKRAFDALILNKLQLAEAARLGITADEETVSRAVNAIAKNNNLNALEFRRALEAEGIDFNTFRQSLRDEIAIRRLRNREVTQKIEVTKSEVDSYLEESGGVEGRTAVRLLYILVAVPDDASTEQKEAARLKAEQTTGQIRDGADFRTLARQVSTGQGAENGGDLGWLSIDGIPPLFKPYVTTMQVGELRGPIAAGNGYHIIQLDDVRSSAAKIVQQTKARHILIRTDEVTSDTDARRRLVTLRNRIIDGDDFDTLARSNSDDKASAIKGGDLGWSTPGNLVPEFEEQMDALDINQVSEPFESQFGWHIVQVLGRRNYDATDEIRRDQARQAVRDQKAEEALDIYLRKLRDEAYIELRLDDIYQ
ncbi:MAG: peptidylprolyl isomerase [Gammaproteobacteria bacterium]|nr:peptidylprolyl isomerase [Gammaproteobacteria bacterium]